MTLECPDMHWMERALALARRGEGFTRPNPPVGAIVVRRGRVLGQGWHHRAGLPHAEVEALGACACGAQGATLYVTLEPCCTFGRTPPCTDLVVRSGVTRVVVGCVDPNSHHAGRGLRILRRAGIEVTTGVQRDACARLIEPFATRLLCGRPFVTLKLAMTLDGRIADRAGTSRWITGEPARREVQAWRRRVDAVMVGAGTVCADDPSLRCRLRGAPHAWRVVVDGAGRTPPGSQVLTDERAADTIMVVAARRAEAVRDAWQRHGARAWPLPARGDGDRISLSRLLRRLAGEGIMHVLCEGGGALAGGLLKAGLVDELLLFYAPAVLGDARAVAGISGADFLLARMPRFRVVDLALVGNDVLVRARPAK